MDDIIKILDQCAYKGKYISMLKRCGLWDNIESSIQNTTLSDGEKLYLYLHPSDNISCRTGNTLKFLGIKLGFGKYCTIKDCLSCKVDRQSAVVRGVMEKYGVDNIGKLPSAISARDQFWSNPIAIAEAAEKRKTTNLGIYGCENVFQNENVKHDIKETIFTMYGVDNVSKSDIIKEQKKLTTLKNYGVEFPLQSNIVQERARSTSLILYGVDFPMQSESVKSKMMETKIANGSFTKSNSSKEATVYFREYVKQQGYDISQIAYADAEYALHEWGYYFDKWYLYDFVAFESGFRGNKNKIIEIVEYHGPFHYTKTDVEQRGNDMAYPWKSKTTTISESYNNDLKKETYARQFLTKNYTIIWSNKND
jgi:hypothetical protein